MGSSHQALLSSTIGEADITKNSEFIAFGGGSDVGPLQPPLDADQLRPAPNVQEADESDRRASPVGRKMKKKRQGRSSLGSKESAKPAGELFLELDEEDSPQQLLEV